MLTDHLKEWKQALKEQECGEENDVLINDYVEESTGNEILSDEPLETDANVSRTENEKQTKKQKSKKICLKNKRSYRKNSIKKINLDDVLAQMVAEDYEPYSIVKHSGFRRILHRANPCYRFPDRNTLAKTLVPNLYRTVENKLIERISDQRCHILTTV